MGVFLKMFLRSACFMKLFSDKKQKFWSGDYFCQVPGYQDFWIITGVLLFTLPLSFYFF